MKHKTVKKIAIFINIKEYVKHSFMFNRIHHVIGDIMCVLC